MHADADRSGACRRSGARSRSDPLAWRWRGGYRIPEIERPRGGREWRSARSSPMAVCAPALRAPRHLRRRRWRRLSSGGRCGDERSVLSMIPVSCPVLGSQRAAHWERGHGGLSDGCTTVEHVLCWLNFPPASASGGPEIFVVRSGKAVLGQLSAAEHDGAGPDGQFCRWSRANAEVLVC